MSITGLSNQSPTLHIILPIAKEKSAVAKPQHMIAPGSSRYLSYESNRYQRDLPRNSIVRIAVLSFAHQARSDGIPVSMPTVPPQGLAFLLVDAATQTEVSEGEASPRLLRSKSLPPMYNLDWP
ncbi:hypothetical protein Tco_0765521 [Tanacetum coccineum]